MSNAAVAVAHGINPNLARRWVREAEQRAGEVPVKAAPRAAPESFVPVQIQAPTQSLPASAAAPPAPAEIRVELQRGSTLISVSWPCAAAAQCAAWLRELL